MPEEAEEGEGQPAGSSGREPGSIPEGSPPTLERGGEEGDVEPDNTFLTGVALPGELPPMDLPSPQAEEEVADSEG